MINITEAITADETHFYVADIGNNGGKRESITVYKYSKSREPQTAVTAMEVVYKDNQAGDNQYLNHDFDAEALVAKGEHLVLFSKSWKTQDLHIYLLDKTQLQQNVVAKATVENLPGIITGADFDKSNKRYVLVGYRRGKLGLSEPFIAMLSSDFELQQWHELKGFAQVEGVCVHPSGEVWFTQEASFFGDNKLVKIRFNH